MTQGFENPRLLKKAVRIVSKKYKKEMKKLYPKGSTIYLLKQNNNVAGGFTVKAKVVIFSTGFSNFRNAQTFQVPSLEDEIVKAMNVISHVSFNNQIYEIKEDDLPRPFFYEFTWKIYARIQSQMKFTPPV